MRKKIYLLGLLAAALVAQAQETVLKGFSYGEAMAPTGKEWESPQELALNKEQPHTWFFHFSDAESARRLLPEHSSYYRSLDGTWKFHWVGNPDERPADFYLPTFDVSGWDDVSVPMQWNVAGIRKDGSLKYGVPIYVNQKAIFQHKVAVGDWKGGVMRTPPQDWTTYKHRNEVGSYRRTFTIPAGWDGREVYINFDGVSSFFYLWINGRYVGFSKNSRNTASFNITSYLNKGGGENVVAVEVYRNSDGSHLETQDMFRLPGIFRSVSLTSTFKVQVRDLRVFPDLDADYNHGTVRIETDLRNLDRKTAKGYTLSFSLYANKLYSDENTPVDGVKGVSALAALENGETASVTTLLKVEQPEKWSAEEPYRYTLVGELKDKRGRVVDAFSTGFGFCKVEIKETSADKDEFGLAGRYYYINGKTVKLKGVNRQEINPETGNVITLVQMEKEIMLMKQGNINHVRNSHYSCHPYWYYMCDKYGIYLEDEANIESHHYYYGDASLSHVPELEAAHVARVMELAHAHVNHPSVVIWSLGNEAGPGKNFVTAYEALHAFDSSRPVQYERNNKIVDMGSNQYPAIAWTREEVKGTYNIKYPFHIYEYAHSMGNAVGNLVDYWEAIESTNFFCGAAIWDWVDQSLYHYDRQTGERYLAYGGDFGDKPNSGMFCMNGILFPGHLPKPAYYEVKKVYQNVGVRAMDMKKALIEVFNKNYFTSLDNYHLTWALYEDGRVVKEGVLTTQSVLPRTKALYTIPYDYSRLKAGSEYFVKVQFKLIKDMPWAKAGFVQMEEQLKVKDVEHKPSMVLVTADMEKPEVRVDKKYVHIEGKSFSVKFDNQTGTIYSLEYDGRKVMLDGMGQRIDAYRAPVDNDNWAYQRWFEKGLHNLEHRVTHYSWINADKKKDNTIQLMYTVESQAPNEAVLQGWVSGKNKVTELHDSPFHEKDFKFVTNQIWTVYPDGSIELRSEIVSNDAMVVLPRLGYGMQVPSSLQRYTYYGRGPWNNYNDRCTGAFIEMYQSTVKEQFVNFPKPQSMGNREEVRWCALTDNEGNGVQFVANRWMSASALPWSGMEMTLAPHPYQLPESTATHLHLDLAVTGLGGNSCGQGGPLSHDRVKAERHSMDFMIRPVRKAAFTETACVAHAGEMPLSIVRDNRGKVIIQSQKTAVPIIYTLNESKTPIDYTAPFYLPQGGTVKAYFKDNKAISSVFSFVKMENAPLEVIYASSEEVGGKDASCLVDRDPGTFWHSAYSVTVAKYPHWVDFDMGEVRSVKGFVYLPRQNGTSNGDIKEYKLQVSSDGKEWGDAVAAGTFEGGKKSKRILLHKTVKGRYIRFTALSSQNGADYAGGAEFSVIVE